MVVEVEDEPVAEPVVVIEEEPTPEAAVEEAPAVEIIDEPAPLAATAAWALLNLILTIITGLVMIWLFISYLFKKKDEDEDDPDKDENVKKHFGIRLISIIATVVAIIVFILTEDMTLPMQWTDKWTIWMAVILLAQLIIAGFSKKKYEEEDLNEENI